MSEPDATFPAGRAEHLHVPAGLAVQRLRLRPARAEDLPFLRRLYSESRAAELAAVPWPEAAKRAFLDSQFALQHRHYLAHYADADFLLLEQAGKPVGRLYVHPQVPDHLIVDISLLRQHRGRGIGRSLIAAVQERAALEGCGVTLHVSQYNEAAWRLYRRLGFEDVAVEGAHRLMRWTGTRSVALS